MRETIILAPGCNGTELLRTLAGFGVNTIGVRVVSSAELAKIAFMKSGISVTEGFLSSGEEPSVICSFLNDIGYFRSASYADAESLAAALHTMRSLIRKEEEEGMKKALAEGTFPGKNQALFEVYQAYLNACRKDGRIDSISLIRMAIEKTEAFDAEFFTLKEYPLAPLDEELLVTVSGGQYRTVSLKELFGRERKKSGSYVFTEGYGTVNEIEDILDDIYRNHIPLDKCVIAFPGGAEVPQTFYDLSKKYGIPVTYGSGVPIANSYPAQLLRVLSAWDTFGYHGIDATRHLLTSEAFDRKALEELLEIKELTRADAEEISAMAGALRISFHKAENDLRIAAYQGVLEKEYRRAEKTGIRKDIRSVERKLAVFDSVRKLAEELSKGFLSFFDRFAVLRPEPELRLDQSSKKVILESLRAYTSYVENADINAIIPQLLNKTVGSENRKEGRLHLTTISGALASFRENLFLCGLSAAEFPGSPVENYLLTDEDLMAFDAEKAVTSVKRIENQKKNLKDLLNLADTLGVRVRMSYSGYSLSELKDKNPSSVLYQCFETDHRDSDDKGFKKSIRKTGYFDSDISETRLIGRRYLEGRKITAAPTFCTIEVTGNPLDKAWSPSALEVFFRCPRHFYLTQILGIPEEEPDDPFAVWSAADAGTVAHRMMEDLAGERVDKDVFLKACGEAFEEFLLSRPPIHRDAADRQKKDFLKMMSTAYDQDTSLKYEVVTAEEEYRHEHPSGVKLHGYPDRVEKDSDGTYVIADFKTKRIVEHVENDIRSCLQVIIYAWLCEQEGLPVSRGEYRYLRKNRTVLCEYDETKKKELNELLCVFRKALETGDFPRNESAENCRYCKHAGICRLHDREEKL